MSAWFVHEALAARVMFGTGTLDRIASETARLGIGKALVLSTPEQADLADRLRTLLDHGCAGIFAGARMHTPVDVTERALQELARCGADGIVAIGGGSTTGLAKALALRTDLPQVIIPTTYAGSEMTPILGETSDGRKQTQRSLKVLPETVMYDVALTLGLPVELSITSGLNAIAHAAEALYAANVSPIVMLMAEESVRAMVRALPGIVADPTDQDARADALRAAWLSGTCLGLVNMGLHHKLCHVLGGAFDLPHAETHGVVLPHALSYNLPAAPEARRRLERATDWPDPAADLFAFSGELGAPRSLRELGMPEEGCETAAELAVAAAYPNPQAIEREPVLRLIRRAWAGEPPAEHG